MKTIKADPIFPLSIFFYLLNAADAFSTWYAAHQTPWLAYELNPQLRAISGSYLLIAFKLVSPLLFLPAMFYLRRRYKVFKDSTFIALIIACGFMAGVVVNNIWGLTHIN